MRKLFLFIPLFFFSATAQSQFLWDTIHTDYDGRYDYCFEAISCSDNVCTACGTFVDNSAQRIYLKFWRSTDAGISWVMQDAGLPIDSNLRVTSYFTKIQQINSNNAVGIGLKEDYDKVNGYEDSAIILRTFDGGNSWESQNLHIAGIAKDMNFYDSANGIIHIQENANFQGTVFVGWGRERIFTTIDGGRHWDSVGINIDSKGSNFALPVFCSGRGKYKIYYPPKGPVYSTINNWEKVDISPLILDTTVHAQKRFFLYGCNFTGDDTLVTYGSYLFDTSLQAQRPSRACIIRSVDGGMKWNVPEIFNDSIWQINFMTNLDKDTIFANGESLNKILLSTDKGITWSVDSMIFTDKALSGYASLGLTISGNGPLTIYAERYYPFRIPSFILKGMYKKSVVNFSGNLGYNQRIYPNPAKTTLNIVSVEASTPYKIIDVLGRTVKSGMVLDHNTLTLDISSLPKGVYYVLVERADIKGVYVIAGKFTAIGG